MTLRAQPCISSLPNSEAPTVRADMKWHYLWLVAASLQSWSLDQCATLQAALISLLITSCDFSCDVEVNLLPFDTQLASHSGQNFTNYQLFLEVCFIAIRFIYYSHLLLIFLCASVLKPTHWEMDVSQLEYTVFTCRLRESFEFNALIIWGGKFVSSYQVSGMFFPC